MKRKLLVSALLFAFNFLILKNSNAQVAAIPFNVSIDTFSVITGTVLDAPNVDDVVYPNLNIGFNFSLGGTMHDKFSACTNGYIELDSSSQMMLFNPLSGSRNNIISPFGSDLKHQNPNASLQYVTVGTAPNRITIVQWLHYSYFGGFSGDINFQIWLYETTNCIRFVYGANSFVSNPMTTQIGIRGTTNLDYIALGDTTCNWAFAFPFPAISTTFPVSLSCSMPSGFEFDFGACGVNSGVKFSYLTGKVFEDKNSNAVLDSGETGIANHIVNINPGNYYVSTDLNGDYTFFFFDSTLTYSITSSPLLYWNQTSPATINVNPLTQSCSGNNFGFLMMPNVHEVSIYTPNWGAKPGQQEPMPISFHNNGTVTENDTIVFEMDSLYSFVSAVPAPFSVSGQTIKWAYSNLAVGGYGSINLQLMPSVNAVLGNYLNSTLTINPVAGDTMPLNNVVELHQLISNSWDPNDKVVEPEGIIAAGTKLNYTIHFQNTGNAAADYVIIKDTLDASGLDLMTLQITGYSHPMIFEMDGNGIATFSFYNIQLPDSGTNFAASNGFVSFSIDSRNTLLPATTINNTAGIYFDFNPAVVTNTVTNIIQIPSAINEFGNTSFVIKANPNPTNEKVIFSFSDNSNEKADLKIATIDGKLVYSKIEITSIESIDISNLLSGIYVCKLQTSSGNKFVKLIKE